MSGASAVSHAWTCSEAEILILKVQLFVREFTSLSCVDFIISLRSIFLGKGLTARPHRLLQNHGAVEALGRARDCRVSHRRRAGEGDIGGESRPIGEVGGELDGVDAIGFAVKEHAGCVGDDCRRIEARLLSGEKPLVCCLELSVHVGKERVA